MTGEKRAHPRVDLRLPLRYQVLAHAGTMELDRIDGVIKENETRDLSRGGASFRTSEYLARDTLIVLIFNFPTLPRPVKAVGMVAWCRQEPEADYRVGVRYLAVKPEFVEGLLQQARNASA